MFNADKQPRIAISNNNCSSGDWIIIDNDSLTIQTSPPIIEGFYYNGSDTVKFGEMYINLFFESFNNFPNQPSECN